MILKEFLANPHVRRISVGRCVDGSSWEDNHTQAHAHTDKEDEYFEWICIRSPRDVLCVHSENVSRTMMHELCHLISGQRWHNDRWRKEMHKWGQPIPKRYQKRRRK